MDNNKPHIQVVWLKRDLRLHDNEAISNALASGERVLLLFSFEPILLEDSHYSERHWGFIKQSLESINDQLLPYNSKVLVIQSEIINAFNQLLGYYNITDVFSHQETGILVTYNRDKLFKRFCRNNIINWNENINNGIYRGLKNREKWVQKWETFMEKEQHSFDPKKNQLLTVPEIEEIESLFTIPSLTTDKKGNFQIGGTPNGTRYLETFLENRVENYMYNISKPLLARSSCSRLSPYLAWGNLSIRQVRQRALEIKTDKKNKKHIDAFVARLRWQAHFIQKFEMEHTMEQSSINKGCRKLKKDISKQYQEAWKSGQTGFPLIDACMRCLKETGYLNFRMRALVTSFFTHNLWQPWQDATEHLSRMFLDFEPGIHFPQLQMQAGETGINMLRIYNPTKNSLEHDPEATFIKKWVPELEKLDTPFAHEPCLMTAMEQNFYRVKLGREYPKPIIDLNFTRKRANDILWSMRKDKTVQNENTRILAKHTLQKKKA